MENVEMIRKDVWKAFFLKIVRLRNMRAAKWGQIKSFEITWSRNEEKQCNIMYVQVRQIIDERYNRQSCTIEEKRVEEERREEERRIEERREE